MMRIIFMRPLLPKLHALFRPGSAIIMKRLIPVVAIVLVTALDHAFPAAAQAPRSFFRDSAAVLAPLSPSALPPGNSPLFSLTRLRAARGRAFARVACRASDDFGRQQARGADAAPLTPCRFAIRHPSMPMAASPFPAEGRPDLV
jgi:hypothetical protein